jgi:hypothetical protein
MWSQPLIHKLSREKWDIVSGEGHATWRIARGFFALLTSAAQGKLQSVAGAAIDPAEKLLPQ